ncbi:MAG TPA: hypothetical protein VKT81_06600 [Bryobacteraceae bacterium]|nr:hypothetical protein [Bryobacteraceae bacterium]
MRLWICLLAFAAVRCASAQSNAPQTFEMEDYLYILNPHFDKHPSAIDLMWIPKTVESLCLGKSHETCSSIDYCSRTTNQNVSTCKNLKMDLSKLPKYPSDSRPKRVLSIAFYAGSLIPNWQMLRSYYDHQPAGTFDRISKSQRIKARLKLKRTSEDDDFEVLEILAVPPL